MKSKAPRERNQFVALALFRKAGSHRKSNKQVRQQNKQEMKNAVDSERK